jgi:hydrogenase maturation protease
MTSVLILAYGNPQRGDDGVAWHAAELLRDRCPTARIECAHQLAPEFAEMAAQADVVLFIDAAQDGEPGHIVCTEVNPAADCGQSSHWLTPAQVMALCRQLYGATPRAMSVSIAGASFDHGATLSDAISSALPELIDLVEDFIGYLSGSGEVPSDHLFACESH